jgi:hypothetical protein
MPTTTPASAGTASAAPHTASAPAAIFVMVFIIDHPF